MKISGVGHDGIITIPKHGIPRQNLRSSHLSTAFKTNAMKKYIISLLFIILAAGSLPSQTVNWAALNNKEKHILNANIGTEYGVIFGLGYGYRLNTACSYDYRS
ncbi:hypothetical protein EJ377_03945 [Chryseobacterium arthrosphaerae]|uniref:Uncharacterized protein n=1 Tax=Chryseobacterium arthrosphaerae TaxID=651561 RepID=A0A3S0Q7F6_9FLAO|nr:hypothetical protein EJ377_03945 [Chryseobacterium arthrosphaerae]